jgi:hypothetical protein
MLMVFCHIVDDYYLQAIGPLASMKQKKWWEENYPQKLYRFDYLVALTMHSLSWAFMIMFPIAVYYKFEVSTTFAVVFTANVIIHSLVDNLKANMLVINLTTDQFIHVLQIIVSFLILIK